MRRTVLAQRQRRACVALDADRPVMTVYDIGDKLGPRRPIRHRDASITNATPNIYVFTFPVALTAGTWFVRAKSTAGLIAAVETSFVVRASDFTTP